MDYSLQLYNMKLALKEVTEQSQLPAQQPKKDKKPAYFQLRNYPHANICEQLTFMLIRPARFVYNPDILNPNKRNSLRFTAQTFNIGFELTLYKQKEMRYVLLYLHGNGSSRFQGCLFLHSLPDRVGMACFDFNGCGNRQEAEFITLGQSESRDVDRAATYLKEQGYVVVGWGRSMGAVSLLTSRQCDIMVADSPYSNLAQLCKETSTSFLPRACCCLVPLLFPCVFCCIKGNVQERSGLQIQRMDIQKHMLQLSKNRLKKSICFIHGKQDTLISSRHSQTLYDAFDGRKKLIFFEGTHNSSRPDEVIEKSFQFIDQTLAANKSETQSAQCSQNNKLKKMIQLQELNKGFVSPANKELRNSKITTKNSKDYLHLQTSYTNAPSKMSDISPQSREEYLENEMRVDIQLLQPSPASKPKSFLTAAKNSDFHLFPSFEGNQSIDDHIKKQVAFEKIAFKGKEPPKV